MSFSNMSLRRSSRKRPSSLYKDFDYESPALKSRGKIELNPEERELLQAVEEPKRYCICRCLETEDKGSLMICCDSCNDWFHITCLCISQEEANEMDTFLCPSCSQDTQRRPRRVGQKRSAQPSPSDIQMLANVLSGISEEKGKKRKYATEYRTTPKISAFHLAEQASYGRIRGIVGYLCNDSHPSPSCNSHTVDNGYMAPITQTDLTRGYVSTRWGTFKIWPGEENRIHVLSDFSTKQPIPDVIKEETDTSLSSGQLHTYRLPERTVFVLDGAQMEIANTKLEVKLDLKAVTELANVLKCPVTLGDVKETLGKRMKYRPSVLSSR